MGDFEARVMRELETLKSMSEKMEGIASISARLDALDARFSEQVDRMDAVQSKVNLAMTSLGEVRAEQVAAARTAKQGATASASTENSRGTGNGLFQRPPPPNLPPLVPPLVLSRDSTQQQFDPGRNSEDSGGKKPWMPKMDFPKFDGSDARIWLDGCSAYFALYDIPAGFRVTSATLHMIGDAAHWFHAYKLQHAWPNWEQFTEAVLQEFDVNVHCEKMRALMLLKQTGTVDEYRKEFHQLVYQLQLYEGSVSETMLVTTFLLGLKNELKPAVEIQVPATVREAALYAKIQEDILSRQKGTKVVPTHIPFQRAESRLNSTASGDLWKARQLKEYRRANGLCFRCGEKFAPGHVCAPNPATSVLNAVNSQDTNGEILSDEVLDAMERQEAAIAAMQLSVCDVSGAAGPSTIQLRACIGNQRILILIDSGSSHSFVDKGVLSRVGVTETPLQEQKSVRVANGTVMQCTSEVRGLHWWVQDHAFQYTVKVLDLGSYDVILGMDWLEQWGEMKCHWKDKWLQFEHNGQCITLQGIQPAKVTQLQELSLEEAMNWHKENEIWASALLDQFADVFATPESLPPSREYDHAIHLIPDAVPVNSRPYCYSPLQKDEIEKQVKEMIAAGLITPSLSPFAAPVLLVKKKDGSWRFCVDYRKLNAVTIKSKFPMPIVDEILDALAGTCWFQYKKGCDNGAADALSRVGHLLAITSCSPYKALYGHEPHYGTFASVLQSDQIDVQQWLQDHNGHSQLLREHLVRAQAKVKQYADKNRSDRSFLVGDSVYLKLQPYAQHPVVNRPGKKIGLQVLRTI